MAAKMAPAEAEAEAEAEREEEEEAFRAAEERAQARRAARRARAGAEARAQAEGKQVSLETARRAATFALPETAAVLRQGVEGKAGDGAGGAEGRVLKQVERAERKREAREKEREVEAARRRVLDRQKDRLRADLKMLRYRAYMDPKRFYKRSNSAPFPALDSGLVQEGTVMSSAREGGRKLSKQSKGRSFAEQVMRDRKARKYVKRKYGELLEQAGQRINLAARAKKKAGRRAR